jgi:hypothetical protein
MTVVSFIVLVAVSSAGVSQLLRSRIALPVRVELRRIEKIRN